MSDSQPIMAGKRGLVMGVANDRSIAWGIAKAAADQGAELAFTYQGEALKKRAEPLAASVGSDMLMQCDVTDDGSVEAVFTDIAQRWDSASVATFSAALVASLPPPCAQGISTASHANPHAIVTPINRT